jgi:peptidoglycan/LPS O-acetylase OafA/YrhL
MNAPSGIRYLPGLDGLRALAVLAVIIYHANKSWLGGGFLGVEVFFVISGYLITTLLIAESDATGMISFRSFWIRRARRLLPALWTMMLAVVIYVSIFEREVLGQLRGDVIAAFFYVFNWFQIWTGSSYFGELGFVPLRHLWSLAVEEQFYLVWPVVIAVLLRTIGRKPAVLGALLMTASVAVAWYVAATYVPGVPGSVVETPEYYMSLFGHTVLRLDFLFLGTLGRSGGLFMGAALAFWFRPSMFNPKHPTSERHVVTAVSLAGLVALGYFVWTMRDVVEGNLQGGSSGYDRLYQGGFFVVGLASIAVICGAVHPTTPVSKYLLGNPVFVWIGRRSYGLYLYHWPVFQFYRQVAGRGLTVVEFVVLMAITLVITELSYRFIEMPIRTGSAGQWWHAIRYPRMDRDRARSQGMAVTALVVAVVPVFALVSLFLAPVQLDEIGQSLQDNEDSVENILGQTTVVATTIAGATTIPAPATTTLDGQIIPLLAIGDSVMLGAADILTSRGVTVDAVKSRPYRQALEIVNYLKSVNRLGDFVIIHLGTNNYVDEKTLDEIMAPLADTELVLFLTAHVPDKPWQDPNNALIRALPDRYGNAKVLDWYQIASENLNYLYRDKVHLNKDGQVFYADLIMQAVGN